MARYIDAEIAIEKCNKLIDNADSCPNPCAIEGVRVVRNIILSDCETGVPTADVVEVKHGKWEIKQDDYDCEYMMCSVCKEEFYPVDVDIVDTTPNYCPNCGAKMDGGAE